MNFVFPLSASKKRSASSTHQLLFNSNSILQLYQSRRSSIIVSPVANTSHLVSSSPFFVLL